jgi:hypothetical protein
MRARLLGAILLGLNGPAAPLTAQQCPEGRTPVGDVGIGGLLCTGPAASCAINVRSSDDGGVHHEFAVEPVIAALTAGSSPTSSSDGALRLGDVLVAVDSVLITTAAGGRRLARLAPHATVRLLVRSDGELREIRMVARRGCGVRSLTVSR